jgi:glycosyltransferase involved in cell wall biosynthesis
MRELTDVARTTDVGILSYIPSNLNNCLASPKKLFEHINAGLPVAASDIPFLRRTVCDNDIGVVFDARDPHSIARSLNQITRTKELSRYRKMIVAAALKYNWQTEERKLLHAYARLLYGFK